MTFCPRCERQLSLAASTCPHCGYEISSPGANEWPWWVKVGLARMIGKDPRSRGPAIKLLLGSIVVDLLCTAVGLLWDVSFLWLAVAFGLCTLWTLLAIRWVDKRGKWPTAR